MKKLDRKISLVIFALMILAVLGLRFYQWQNSVDLDTGFFKSGSMSETVVAICVAVGTILFAIPLYFGSSKVAEGKISAFDADNLMQSRRPSVVLASLSLMIGLFTAWDIYQNISAIKAFTVLRYILFGLEIISVIVFLVLAVNQYLQKQFPEMLGFMFLVPTMWSAFRAAQLFKNSVALTSNSQNLLKMMYLLSTILFFVYFARYRAGLSKKRTKQIMLVSAMLTAVLGIAMVVPLFVYDKSIGFEYSSDLLYCDLSISLFAAWTILCDFGKDYNDVAPIIQNEIVNTPNFIGQETTDDETPSEQ